MTAKQIADAMNKGEFLGITTGGAKVHVDPGKDERSITFSVTPETEEASKVKRIDSLGMSSSARGLNRPQDYDGFAKLEDSYRDWAFKAGGIPHSTFVQKMQGDPRNKESYLDWLKKMSHPAPNIMYSWFDRFGKFWAFIDDIPDKNWESAFVSEFSYLIETMYGTG